MDSENVVPLEGDQTVMETTELDDDTSAGDHLVDDIETDINGSVPQDSAVKLTSFLNNVQNGASIDDTYGFFPNSSIAASAIRLPGVGDPVFKTAEPSVSVNIPPARFDPLPYATSRSGYVYDTRMRFHVALQPDDTGRPHEEDPRRIADIFRELVDAGLIAPQDEEPSEDQMIRIRIRQATHDELRLVHVPHHIEFIEGTAGYPNDELKEIGATFDSIYFHNLSWLCATLSAGGAIEATRAVVSGQVRNAFAIIRPPGHHAESDKPSGFCFFNNVPIAAKAVQAEFPAKCRKILILDWDVHHGNGVQRAFYDNPNVLYISLHVHENGKFYPLGDYKDHLHCGEGAGLGRTVNIPWISVGMGDGDYIFAFQQIVMPIAIEFDPDLVMISAGFDAAVDDPLGACNVTPAGFAHMTHMLKQLAKGRVVACLEGGYNLRSIAKSALAMTKVLMGEPPDRLGDITPSAKGIRVVQDVIRTQSKFWKCMYPKNLDIQLKKQLGSERLHDIVREWQAQRLWNDHQMSPLFILRSQISKSFKDQVLATPNYHEARPLLLIFHDPPEAMGFPNPRTNELELHNTWLTDVSKKYIDWAVEQDFAVIDVNIPKHITTDVEDNKGYEDTDPEFKRAAMTREVSAYLWQNYIEVGDSTHIFLLGIGDAYVGLIDLLGTHKTAINDVNLTISFVASNKLRALQRDNDDSAVGVYYRHSLVFVAEDHSAFDPDAQRKPKKRHGRIMRSPAISLQEMLYVHMDEVKERLLAETEIWRSGESRKVGGSDMMELDQTIPIIRDIDTNGGVDVTG